MIVEEDKKEQKRICHYLKEEMADMKQQLDNAKDTILDLWQQNEDTPLELNDLQFILSKTIVMHPNGKGATKKLDVVVVSLIMQLLIGGAKPTAIHIIL